MVCKYCHREEDKNGCYIIDGGDVYECLTETHARLEREMNALKDKIRKMLLERCHELETDLREDILRLL